MICLECGGEMVEFPNFFNCPNCPNYHIRTLSESEKQSKEGEQQRNP